jgi:glycosyltransferase involved in cell wall biosynthesis
MPKLSIIISNRNDISMLVVTIRSCIEAIRPLGKGGAEVVIVDNSDPEAYQLIKSALPTGYCRDGTLKVSHQDFPCLFTAREQAAEEASGEYILCLDSHMLVGHNTVVDLVNFMDRKSDDPTLGFAHAPISWAHQHEQAAKHDRDMTVNELGNWGLAYDHERTITWKGMPWICRRSWFLDRVHGLNGYGALAQHRVSWGGGDMHIGVKPWLLGFKNWAVPTNPCIHIGPFPKLDNKTSDPNVVSVSNRQPGNERYRLYSTSGNFPHTFGFLVSCYVLGGEHMMLRNKEAISNRFGRFINVNKWWDKAKELGQDERKWLTDRQVMSFEQLLEAKPWN